VLALAVWLVGRRNFSPTTGALAALLLILSPIFEGASHLARPDILLAAVFMGVFGLATFALDLERWWAHLLAGLLAGLSLDIHPNGSLLLLALAGTYLAAYRSTIFRQKGAGLVVVGIGMGLTYYLAIHLLVVQAKTSAANYAMLTATSSTPPIFTGHLTALWTSFVAEFRRLGLSSSALGFGLILGAVAYLAVRRSRADYLLLVFTGTAFAGFILFIGNKSFYYAIIIFPFLVLMLAEAIVSFFRSGRLQRTWRPAQAFAGILLLLLLLQDVRQVIVPIMKNRSYDYYSVVGRMTRSIPPGVRIMGMPHWWFGFAGSDYRSSLDLTFYHFLKGFTLTQGLDADRPDILIVDDVLRNTLVDQGYFQTGPGMGYYNLPREELEQFLTQRGQKIDEFTDPVHGRFEVYQIRWD
jgi:hypothetical protein